MMTHCRVRLIAILFFTELTISSVFHLHAEETHQREVAKLLLFHHGYTDCLRMKVQVDGKALDFMVDTGAEINVIDSEIQDKVCSDPTVVGKSKEFVFLKKADLATEIGNVECSPIAVYSFSSANRILAADICGVIGLPILSECAIENVSGDISLVEKVLNTNKLRSIDLQKGIRGSLSTSDVEICGIRHGSFLIDTGYNGAISVDEETFAELQANGQLSELQTRESFSMKGQYTRKVAIVKELNVWGISFSSVPISESDRFKIGLEVLRRIEFRLSFHESRIFVSENRHSKVPFCYNRTGLSIASLGRNIIVDSVTLDSDAMQCGLKIGDIVKSVDGYKVERNRMNAARMRIAVGTAGGVRLDVSRDGLPIRVKLGK